MSTFHTPAPLSLTLFPPLSLILSLSLSSDTNVDSSYAVQWPHAPAPLNPHLSQYSANNRFSLSFCFDFLSNPFPLTDSVISFMLCLTLYLVIPFLKSFCSPLQWISLSTAFIDNFTIVFFSTDTVGFLTHNTCMFVEISTI